MAKPDLTFQDLRRRAENQLQQHNIEDAALDVKLLLMKAAGCDAADLIVMSRDPVDQKTLAAFSSLLKRRLTHEPIAYILGVKEFWSLSFKVTPDVLIPRPETELLVEHGLKQIEGISHPSILDIGTGSGAILLSLLHERKDASGMGVDISTNALKIARENAENLALGQAVSFQQSDYLSTVDSKFDLIVSNPPYITGAAMQRLPKTIASYEPSLALDGGNDGLNAYRAIIDKAAQHLSANGSLIFEIGFDQGQAVSALFSKHGFIEIFIEIDLAGHDRIVCGKLST